MNINIKKLSISAIFIAVATITSLIKIFSFPFGGSITLCSSLFIIMPAYICGTYYGIISGLTMGLINYIMGPYFLSIPQFLLDYILAFSVMGLAGIFRNIKNGLLIGYIVAIILRWIVATFAGLMWVEAGSTVWDNWNPILYSMVYNAIYIFAEGLISIIIISIPKFNEFIDKYKIL